MEPSSSFSSITSPSRPSLFELISESQLNSLLPPTCRYLLVLLTQRHPRYLLRILNAFDEVYALLSVVVEKYYLDTFGGGFTENFYGLKREKVLPVLGGGGELARTVSTVPDEVRERVRIGGNSRGDVWRNLAVMVGVPYLKRKLDEAYDIHVAPSMAFASTSGPQYVDRFAMPPDAMWRQKLWWYYKWFLRKVYPSINAAYYLSTLAFSLAYLFNGTKYASPFLWLVGTRIRKLEETDYRAFALAAEQKPSRAAAIDPAMPRWRSIFDRRILSLHLLSSLKLLLPASIFALKFLEWWHASDFSRQLSKKAAQELDLPPPIVTGMGRGRTPAKIESSHELEMTTPPSDINDNNNNNNNSSIRKTTNENINPYWQKRRWKGRPPPPISATTHLPILTVAPPPTSDLCPICLHPITNPTACQTGYVFDYRCIFQWLQGTHDRQRAWMNGERTTGDWDDDSDEDEDDEEEEEEEDGDEDIGSEQHVDGEETPLESTQLDQNTSGQTQWQRRQRRRTVAAAAADRKGEWDMGTGRCAITGRRVLGGTDGLRRVVV